MYGDGETDDVVHDALTRVLHVLTFAGFGISYLFLSRSKNIDQIKHDISYQNALSLILQNFIIWFLIPCKLLSVPITPFRFRKVGEVTSQCNKYTLELVRKERSLLSKRDPGASNLASSPIRVSEAAKMESDRVFPEGREIATPDYEDTLSPTAAISGRDGKRPPSPPFFLRPQ